MFDTLTLDKIQASIALTLDARTALLFYHNDHWQNSAGYIGPRPDPADDVYSQIMTEIERAFVARNIVGEVVDRHANGCVGRDIVWHIALKNGEDPDETQKTTIDEAQRLLKRWIDINNAQETIDNAIATLMCVGRAPLRILIPEGRRDENGEVPAGPIDDQIEVIFMDHPQPDVCGVITDPDTRYKAGAFLWTDDEGVSKVELTYRDPANKDVLIWQLRGFEPDDVIEYQVVLAGDTLPVYEMTRRAIISPQVQTQQKLHNLACTMKARNVVLGGFLERTLLNAQLNGKTIEVGGQKRFVADPLTFGAGQVNRFVGVITRDAEGNETMNEPKIIYRDPVPVDTFLRTEDASYMAILGEVHQLHYAIAGDATPSGEARISAMADYVIDLLKTKKRIDDAWRWMGNTVLKLTATLAGQPNMFDEFEVIADTQIDAGPVSTEMMRAVIELVRERLLSADTGRSWVGVSDPREEEIKIKKEIDGAALGAIDQIAALLEQDAARQNGDQPGDQPQNQNGNRQGVAA